MDKKIIIELKAIFYGMKQIPLMLFSNKKIKEKDIALLKLPKENISYFNLSSNCITVIDYEDKLYFFRECKRHSDLKKYFHDAIMQFPDIALNGRSLYSFKQKILIDTDFEEAELQIFGDYLAQCETKKGFYRKIRNTDAYLKAINFYVWGTPDQYFVNKSVLDKIGLTDFPEQFRRILPLFLLYMRGVAYNYRMNSFIKRDNLETFNASKALASWKAAQLFQCEELLTSSKMISLECDGKKRYGVLCEAADGLRANDCDCKVTPALQKALTRLSLLDLVCYQKDHGLNNYNLIFDNNGLPVSVCAFDNDNPYTFWPFGKASFYTKNADRPLLMKGSVQIPYLDKNLVKRIMNIDEKCVREYMSQYLNYMQYRGFMKRLRKLQVALKKFNKDNIITDDAWNQGTISKEMSGNYGKTYCWLLEKRK